MQRGSVCKKIRPSSGSQPDFERTAADFARHLHHGIVLTDFAILELGHPDLIHPLGLEHFGVIGADDMAFGQQFLPAGAENGTAEDPPCRLLYVDCLSTHRVSGLIVPWPQKPNCII